MLSCECGNRLIERYAPSQFLGIGVRCGRCGTVTATPGLEVGTMPASAVITADVSSAPRVDAMTVPAHAAVVGRAEKDRLAALLRPGTPADTPYHVTPALLEEAVSAYKRHAVGSLPEIVSDPAAPFAELRDHALAWAVGHLRRRMRNGSLTGMADAATANAVTHVAGFLHFVAAWSHHPLFPAMVATAGEDGFSLHGLAQFAAASSMVTLGNRINFVAPEGSGGTHPGIRGWTRG